jgi:hypothetical protein
MKDGRPSIGDSSASQSGTQVQNTIASVGPLCPGGDCISDLRRWLVVGPCYRNVLFYFTLRMT